MTSQRRITTSLDWAGLAPGVGLDPVRLRRCSLTRACSHYGRKRERVAWDANRGSSFDKQGSRDWRSWRGEQQRVAAQDARSLRVAAENVHHCVAKARRVPNPPSPLRLAMGVFGG